jgi:hypothetical protein
MTRNFDQNIRYPREVKLKVKLSLCLINYASRHEDVWGSGGKAPPFLTSALDGVESLASRPQEKSPTYPLDGRQCGPQSRSGCCGKEKNVLPLPGIEPRTSQPVAIPTELSRLLPERFAVITLMNTLTVKPTGYRDNGGQRRENRTHTYQSCEPKVPWTGALTRHNKNMTLQWDASSSGHSTFLLQSCGLNGTVVSAVTFVLRNSPAFYHIYFWLSDAESRLKFNSTSNE